MVFKDVACALGAGILITIGLIDFGLSTLGSISIGAGLVAFGMIWVEPEDMP